MAQSLVQLPETAEISCFGTWLKIENHGVVNNDGLYNWILGSISCGEWNDVLPQMKQQNISFEAVIETCIEELDDTINFVPIVNRYHDDDIDKSAIEDATSARDIAMKTFGDKYEAIVEFAWSNAGKELASDIIDKIRDCHNWNELYIFANDKFHGKVEQRIMNGIKQCKV